MRILWTGVIGVLLMLALAFPVSANDGIVFESETIVVHPDKEGVSVHTILHVVNTSPSAKEVLWELPANSDQLQILVGDEDFIVIDKKKLQRKEPLAGNADFTIVYRYRYTFPAGTSDFNLPLSYPAQQMQLLLPEENKDVSLLTTLLFKEGAMDFEGKAYIFYKGTGLSAGEVKIGMKSDHNEITVPPFHSKALINLWKKSMFHSVNPHLLLGLFVLVVGGGGWLAYSAFKKRREQAELFVDEEEQRFLDLYRQNQFLFSKLADLQKKLDSGELDSAEYATRKAAYMEKMVTNQLELKQLIS